MSKQPYYITTAILYATGKPHIGNFYDQVAADLLARWRRMRGFDVKFLVGTDEHGQKVETLAAQHNLSPYDFTTGVVNVIKESFAALQISYDQFIRTTDDYHKAAVQNIFQQLLDQGNIYKDEYEGLYCTPCESFWTDSQLQGGMCPDCNRAVQPAKEEAYFLRLSKYQAWLEQLYADQPDFIVPKSRMNEMLNSFIKPGLQDLCVTRSTIKWGIPVPNDPAHVLYVWIDALSNYITALGYDAKDNSDAYRKHWPADLHVIGKDICRFHTIIWPIMLHALGQPLPKRVFAHPWLLFGADKMSKSRGNMIYADELAELLGSDAVRYYLLAEMPQATDGSITREAVIERYNGDLANVLGNLVNRTLAMTNKYFGGVVPAMGELTDLERELKAFAQQAVADYSQALEEYRIADAMEAAMSLAKRSNKYIDETTPWALAKDPDKLAYLGTVMAHLLGCIRTLAGLFAPVMPQAAASIYEQLGCAPHANWDELSEFSLVTGTQVTDTPKALFARVDAEKFLSHE
ncbi:MAG: methionine--tRNA ligase [Oscillospiraceae bacterium]|nr:methionine--tRNA ligase [Oscillospiraceae bacterium]